MRLGLEIGISSGVMGPKGGGGVARVWARGMASGAAGGSLVTKSKEKVERDIVLN